MTVITKATKVIPAFFWLLVLIPQRCFLSPFNHTMSQFLSFLLFFFGLIYFDSFTSFPPYVSFFFLFRQSILTCILHAKKTDYFSWSIFISQVDTVILCFFYYSFFQKIKVCVCVCVCVTASRLFAFFPFPFFISFLLLTCLYKLQIIFS